MREREGKALETPWMGQAFGPQQTWLLMLGEVLLFFLPKLYKTSSIMMTARFSNLADFTLKADEDKPGKHHHEYGMSIHTEHLSFQMI